MEKKPYHHKNLKNDLIEKGIELVNKNGINQLSLRKVAQALSLIHILKTSIMHYGAFTIYTKLKATVFGKIRREDFIGTKD